MTTETRPVPQTREELEKALTEYVHNNKWHNRDSLKKGLKENPNIPIPHNIIDEVVDNTLWPGEKRKGNVIYSESVRYGAVFHRVGDDKTEYAVKEVSNYHHQGAERGPDKT